MLCRRLAQAARRDEAVADREGGRRNSEAGTAHSLITPTQQSKWWSITERGYERRGAAIVDVATRVGTPER